MDEPISNDPRVEKKKIQIKVVVLGDVGVGKTTMVDLFSEFSDYSESNKGENVQSTGLPVFQKTLCADLITKNVSVEKIFKVMAKSRRPRRDDPFVAPSDIVEIKLWDTAGFDRFDVFPPDQILNGSHVVIFCFSVDRKTSLTQAKRLIDHCVEKGRTDESCIFMSLGTKADLFDSVLPSDHSECRKNFDSNEGPFDDNEKHVGNYEFLKNFTKKPNKGQSRCLKNVAEMQMTDSLQQLRDIETTFLNYRIEKSREFVSKFKSFEADQNEGERKNNSKDPPNDFFSYKKNDVLMSFTTCFCKCACVHNPVFCIFYAIARNVELRSEYKKYAATAKTKSSKFDETNSVDLNFSGFALGGTDKRGNGKCDPEFQSQWPKCCG